jgi:hypothetical protein
MKTIVTIVATVLVLGTAAQAGEVFMTKDAQGRPIYTDRPDSLPAQKLNVATKSTEPVEVKNRYDETMKNYTAADKAATQGAQQATEQKQAKELSALDKAKRCSDSRLRYEYYMNAQRLYEAGPNDERRYLNDDGIDAARTNAKTAMDELCAGL